MWPLKRAATAGFVGCAHRTFPFLVGVIFSRHRGRGPFLHGLASCVLARASISEERPRPHSLAPSSASRMSSSQTAARPTSACCSPSKSPRSPTSGSTRCVLGVISLGGCVVAWLLGCRRCSRCCPHHSLFRTLSPHFPPLACHSRHHSSRSGSAPARTASVSTTRWPATLRTRSTAAASSGAPPRPLTRSVDRSLATTRASWRI